MFGWGPPRPPDFSAPSVGFIFVSIGDWMHPVSHSLWPSEPNVVFRNPQQLIPGCGPGSGPVSDSGPRLGGHPEPTPAEAEAEPMPSRARPGRAVLICLDAENVARRSVVWAWIRSDPGQGLSQGLVSSEPGSAQIWARIWSDLSQDLARSGSGSGQIWVRIWSDLGQDLVRSASGSGQI